MAEQRIRNAQVSGSTPLIGSSKQPRLLAGLCFIVYVYMIVNI